MSWLPGCEAGPQSWTTHPRGVRNRLMITLLAAESQQVTAWPQRLLLTLGVLAVSALAVWGCGAVGSDEKRWTCRCNVCPPDLSRTLRWSAGTWARPRHRTGCSGWSPAAWVPGQRLGQRGGAGRTSGTHRGIVDLPAGRPDHRHRTRPRGGGAGGGERRSGPVVLERWDTPCRRDFAPTPQKTWSGW